ncbi:hypothetical protein BCF11_3408 [Collimonas sp. PA-H2]|nr:hypothetical protein BCF11_3408 [Collimonas sp. PA-H2]
MKIDHQISFETANNISCSNSRSMLRKSVDGVEPGVRVDAKIDQTQSLKKIVYSRNFLHSVTINRTVHNLSTFDVREYSDPVWGAAKGLHGKRADPISDFGIKVGCFVTAAEMRFHAVIAILLKGMWKYMLRRPRWTWQLCLWHAAPFFSITDARSNNTAAEPAHTEQRK